MLFLARGAVAATVFGYCCQSAASATSNVQHRSSHTVTNSFTLCPISFLLTFIMSNEVVSYIVMPHNGLRLI